MCDKRLPDYTAYRLKLEVDDVWKDCLLPLLKQGGYHERIMRWLNVSVAKVNHAMDLVNPKT